MQVILKKTIEKKLEKSEKKKSPKKGIASTVAMLFFAIEVSIFYEAWFNVHVLLLQVSELLRWDQDRSSVGVEKFSSSALLLLSRRLSVEETATARDADWLYGSF